MTRKKRAQKTDSHDNDYRAINDLKRVFGNWHIEGKHDFFSKIEYGQDSMVTIVDGTDITGAEFRVQSKVFTSEKRVQGKKLSANVKVSTLNSLADLPVPVIFHFVDYVNSVSYWMWFDEWYAKNYDPSWEQEDKITVSIIKSEQFLFTVQCCDDVRRRVYSSYEKALLLKSVSLHSEIDPDFRFDFFHRNNQTEIVVVPKHSKPRDIQINLSGENAVEFTQAFQTDQFAHFQGRVEFINFPDIPGFPWTSDDGTLTFTRAYPQGELIRIDFLDEYGISIFPPSTIKAKYEALSAKTIQLSGFCSETFVEFSLIQNSNMNQTSFTLHLDPQFDKDVVFLESQILKFSATREAHQIKFNFLERTAEPYILSSNQISSLSTSPMDEQIHKLIIILASIQQKLGQKIFLPDYVNLEVIRTAKAIRNGLETGIMPYWGGDVLTVNFGVTDVPHFLSSISGDGKGVARFSSSDPIDFYGQKLNLGIVEYDFENLTCANHKDVITTLSHFDKFDEVLDLALVFKIDYEKANMKLIDGQNKDI